MTNTQVIPYGHIDRRERIRKVDKARVAALTESIRDVGLLNPPTVVPAKIWKGPNQIDGFRLVAGEHRIEALASLGILNIPCIVVNLEDQQRIIAECDENLCGSRLTPPEEALFTAKRKAAYEALHPETAHGGDRKSSRKSCDLNENDDEPERFTSNTAAATGKSERKVQLDAERGEAITDEALALLTGTKLGTGVYMDALKKVPKEEQEDKVRADLEGLKKSKRPSSPPSVSSKIEKDVVERAAAEIAEILAEFVPGDHWDGVKANLYAAKAKGIANAFSNLTGNSVMDKAGWS